MILRGVRALSRDGVDDILVGGVEATLHGAPAKADLKALNKAQVSLQGLDAAPTMTCAVEPAALGLSAARTLRAEVGPGETVALAHPKGWGPLEPGGQALLLAVIRRPRWFGQSRATFIARGAAHPRRVAQAALEATQAIWQSGWLYALLAIAAAAAVIGVRQLIEVFTALQKDGAISTIGSIQILLTSALFAWIARPIVSALSQRMGPIAALTGAAAMALGVLAGSEPVIRQYEKVEWLLDPPSYFIETVGKPTETFLHNYRDFCKGRGNDFGRSMVTCEEVLTWTQGMEGLKRPALSEGEVRSLRAQVLFFGWLAVFFPVLAYSVTRARLRVVHDMSMLVWSGGADLPARVKPG